MTSFRFGAASGAHGDARAWGEAARRLETLGFSALLVPDTLFTPSPFLALTAAAAATSTLHVGTWVLSAPLRTPVQTVRETRTIVELSSGRFELGIGAGRPRGDADATTLGVSWGSPRERVDRVEETLKATKEAFGDDVPITLAASGSRMLGLAVQYASTLRNLGRAEESAALLSAEREAVSDALDDAVTAFLALALTDLGREREAVSLALGALSRHLPQYNRSVAGYATALMPDEAAG